VAEAVLGLPVPPAPVQCRLAVVGLCQRAAQAAFEFAQPLAATPQRMKMVQLIGQRRLAVLLAFLIHRCHPFGQGRTAIAGHLLQRRQLPKFLGPRLAAERLDEAAVDPAQALGFHDHQHGVGHIDLIRRGLPDLSRGVFVRHGQQGAGLLTRCFAPAPQGRHTGDRARPQDVEQRLHLGKTDAHGLGYTSHFGLLVPIEDDGLGQTCFQRGHALLGLAQRLPQVRDLLPPPGSFQRGQGPSGFAVDRLAADPSLQGPAADVAIATAHDGEGTSNP
jgi:hypothetical protein